MWRNLGMSGDFRRSSLWTDLPSRKGSIAPDRNSAQRRFSDRRSSSRWGERFSSIGRKMLNSKRSAMELGALEDLPAWREKTTLDGFRYFHNTKTDAVQWEKPDDLKTKKEIEDDAGEWVWVPHPIDVWQPARMAKGSTAKTGGAATVKTLDGESIKIPFIRVMKGTLTSGVSQKVPLWSLKRSWLSNLEDDLVMLEALDEGLLMHALRERYKRDKIYTWVGSNRSVLVSINPFKGLPIYDDFHIKQAQEISTMIGQPPHVYSIAHDSLESLIYENRNQSILISGESGAGKTECTKQCLDFLAAVAGAKVAAAKDAEFFLTSYDDDQTVEQKVLLANPVLEAFGNAKTVRNNNSSRFGKWIEVHIDRKKQIICGAQITPYLLERTRVVMQQKGERNYHIFYQMFSDEWAKENCAVNSVDDFFYLNQTGTTTVDHMDDGEEFTKVTGCMDSLGFDQDEKEWLLRMTAGILYLGNTVFKTVTLKDRPDAKGAKVVDKTPVIQAAKLFQVDANNLAKVLTRRSVTIRGERSVIPLKLKEAVGARDSMAKAVYGRVFTWLVDRINTSFGGIQSKMVGILDIFGFEIFDHNSFEQLCINYCNERLQQHFNDNTFRDEEELYVIEGVKYKKINFSDSQPTLDLIEKSPGGILPLLDDEGVVPGGSDVRFYNRMVSQYESHAKFSLPRDKKKGDNANLSFEIDHYAHKVRYDAKDFLLKNSDTLFQDMYDVFAHSTEEHTQTMFPKLDDEKRIQVKSIGNQFRMQLNQLMKSLSKTQSRFIRCIKPNADQVPNRLDSRFAIDQLRSSGVFEAVEIRKTGFPFRYTHQEFATRYRCINVGYEYKAKLEDWKALCEEILYVSPQKFAGVQFGSMRVLYRVKDHKVLKLLRNIAIERLLPKLQALGRAHVVRQLVRDMKKVEEDINEAMGSNEVRELDDAIEAADNAAQTVEGKLGVLPQARNLAAAKGLRKDLQKWVKLEDQMENLEYEEAEEVVEELKAVLEKAKKLSQIPMTSRQEGLLSTMKEMLGTQITMPKEEEDEDDDDPVADVTEEPAAAEEVEAQVEIPDEPVEVEVKADEASDSESSSPKKGKKGNRKKKGDKKKGGGKKKNQPPLSPDALAHHDKLKKVDKEVKAALSVLDRPRMVVAMSKAKAERHKSREVREIKKLLKLPEIEFVRLELNKAKEWKDNKRVAHRTIRLKELRLRQYEHEFRDLSKYPQLRDPKDFATAGFSSRFLNKEKIAAGMLKWSSKVIATSLVSLPPYGNKLKSKALHSFRGIMSAMKDRKSNKPVEFHMQEVVMLGLQNPLLRAEIFCQLIKQLTNNPKPASVKAGWEIMRLIITAFPPDDEFESYLVVWLKNHMPKGEDVRAYQSAMHAVQFGGLKLDPERQPDLNKLRRAFKSTKKGSRYSIRYADDQANAVVMVDGTPQSVQELRKGARESIIEEDANSVSTNSVKDTKSEGERKSKPRKSGNKSVKKKLTPSSDGGTGKKKKVIKNKEAVVG